MQSGIIIAGNVPEPIFDADEIHHGMNTRIFGFDARYGVSAFFEVLGVLITN